MATTINSSKLDFQQIKDTLKQSLKDTQEFEDYDFEASGLSNILDVLAYNTHLNGLIANFSLNESYLVTAQLRPSVVSLAESLGYVPNSKKSPESTVEVEVNTVDLLNVANNQTLQPGQLVLRGVKDGIDYTFSNRESISAVSRGGEVYRFAPTADASQPIRVFEGEEVNLQFVVGDVVDTVYVIPDENIDINTAIVKVYTNQEAAATDGSSVEHTNLLNATTITELSRLYVLRESPNGFYELTFGNGNSLGQAPQAGNVININYLRTNGAIANNIPTLRLSSSLEFVERQTGDAIAVPDEDVSISVQTRSAGGDDKEDIESIRIRAPYQYAAQNRMVTATDYSAIILKRYANYIDDIKSWGGEDDDKPDYGAVFTSIVFKENLTNATIDLVRRGILDLADEFSIASFRLNFTDPVETFISAQTFFQWNPSLTGNTESTIRADVQTAIDNYFNDNTGKFDQVFRRSNMLTKIDATNPSVLSSRSNIRINRRITPVYNLQQNHELYFPVALRDPTLVIEPTITSSLFIYRNQTCFIRNKLDKRVRISPPGINPVVFDSKPSSDLELVSISGRILVSNIGSYNAAEGIVKIDGLTVQSIPNARNFIKIFAVPANESVVVAKLNNVVKYDAEESFAKAILVDTE
jgi:hypothetical protein